MNSSISKNIKIAISVGILCVYYKCATIKKLPPYTLAGFDLTTRSSNLIVGRRRYLIPLDHAAAPHRANGFSFIVYLYNPTDGQIRDVI
jgi:hypothetical protein